MGVYDGDTSSKNDIKALVDGHVKRLGKETEVYNTLIKYVFQEQFFKVIDTGDPGAAVKSRIMLADRVKSRAERIQHLAERIKQSRVGGPRHVLVPRKRTAGNRQPRQRRPPP